MTRPNNPVKRPPKGSYIGPWLVIQPYIGLWLVLQLCHISIIVSLSASKSVYICTCQHVVKGLIRLDQRSRCVGIDSYKFSLLSQHSYIHYILCKCMNQSFQKFTLIFMQFPIGKKIKKNKFEIRFPKAKTGFRF